MTVSLLAALSIFLVRSVGIAAGTPSMRIMTDTRPRVPIVEIEGIRDGNLVGRISGDVRVFLAGKQILSASGGAFRVPADALRYDVHTVSAPQGAQFVASKKGKRFYPIGAPAAESLAPKNRIYFSTEEEAKKAGYK